MNIEEGLNDEMVMLLLTSRRDFLSLKEQLEM